MTGWHHYSLVIKCTLIVGQLLAVGLVVSTVVSNNETD